MADTISKNARSRIMSNIRSNNTAPELRLKKILRGQGFEYQPRVFGNPDFINFQSKMVVFVNGCFWHQCPLHSRMPKQNLVYWAPKLERNLTREIEVDRAYKLAGWKVIRIWEHDLIGRK
jgi:DNA mismatch endonuclease (patch repair protein)